MTKQIFLLHNILSDAPRSLTCFIKHIQDVLSGVCGREDRGDPADLLQHLILYFWHNTRVIIIIIIVMITPAAVARTGLGLTVSHHSWHSPLTLCFMMWMIVDTEANAELNVSSVAWFVLSRFASQWIPSERCKNMINYSVTDDNKRFVLQLQTITSFQVACIISNVYVFKYLPTLPSALSKHQSLLSLGKVVQENPLHPWNFCELLWPGFLHCCLEYTCE